mmetsp:Transcript_5945/g.15957  ORF Transcript_5945/g.15957 Transcript_5945/m.15957 type:complete len:249 (+) Transcript_5945:438-1184(+)
MSLPRAATLLEPIQVQGGLLRQPGLVRIQRPVIELSTLPHEQAPVQVGQTFVLDREANNGLHRQNIDALLRLIVRIHVDVLRFHHGVIRGTPDHPLSSDAVRATFINRRLVRKNLVPSGAPSLSLQSLKGMWRDVPSPAPLGVLLEDVSLVALRPEAHWPCLLLHHPPQTMAERLRHLEIQPIHNSILARAAQDEHILFVLQQLRGLPDEVELIVLPFAFELLCRQLTIVFYNLLQDLRVVVVPVSVR